VFSRVETFPEQDAETLGIPFDDLGHGDAGRVRVSLRVRPFADRRIYLER
jgi:hypothetical protein